MRRIQHSLKRSARRGRILRSITLLCLVCFGLSLMERQIRPVMITMAQYECRQLCMTAMNQAVADAVALHPERFCHLYQIRTTPEGRIASIVADPQAVNTLKTDLTTQVTHRLSVLGANLVSIPLGTLLGWQLFAGRGPVLHLRILQESYVDSDMTSRLRDCGVNQTEFLVFITFHVTMSVMLSGYSTRVEVSDEICIAQALLAGETPRLLAR